jgi:hypothetical protein
MRAHLAIVTAIVLATGTVAAGQNKDGRCDRDCLIGIAEQYLDALAAKDAKRLTLTGSNIPYTENGQRLKLDDGLWNSISGRGTYKLHVADTTTGNVVSFATMRENGTPLILAVRLRVEKQRISEIETIVARSENGAKGLEAMGQPREAFARVVPPNERMTRPDLVRTANMYFSGMQLNDGKGKYPFADDCHRIENGAQATNAAGRAGEARPDPKTATRYSGMWSCREQFESGLLHFVSRIRDRRYVAVDHERGLVVAFVFFDHDAGASRNFTTPSGREITNAGPAQPWTWMIAELFRVDNGLLHEIEAILERVPYGMPSGWSSWNDAMSDKIQWPR